MPFRADSLNISISDPVLYGEHGIPIPDVPRSDSVIALVLLFCFVAAVVSVTHLRGVFLGNLKNLFYPQHKSGDAISDTSAELRYQLLLAFIGCILYAVSTLIVSTHFYPQGFVFDRITMMGVLTAMFVAYFLCRMLLYTIVNVVFFDGKRNLRFLHYILFLSSVEAILLLPMAVLQVYFGLEPKTVLYYVAIVLILNKIHTFYLSWSIFFRRNGGVLQTFLYFCALEITPLLAFCVAGLMIVKALRVIF